LRRECGRMLCAGAAAEIRETRRESGLKKLYG
jgi:hypothetical protein